MEACARGSRLSLLSAMFPSIPSAVEQSDVDVSISIIFPIVLSAYSGNKPLEVGEHGFRQVLEQGVYPGVVQKVPLDQLEG